MTNPIFNPQPNNYSGVTIQIANPAVNVSPQGNGYPCTNVCPGYTDINGIPYAITNESGINRNTISANKNYTFHPHQGYPSPLLQNGYKNGIPDDTQSNQKYQFNSPYNENGAVNGMTTPDGIQNYPNAYPAQYYLNNYNYGINGDGNYVPNNNGFNSNDKNKSRTDKEYEHYTDNKTTNGNEYSAIDSGINSKHNYANNEYSTENSQGNYSATKQNDYYPENQQDTNSYRMYADKNSQKNTDMSRSKNIIGDLADREAEIQEEKKNTKETKIVALTDEYIKSLENYLNNPNDEIRLMASKEILTRLDEDKDRYNDAALNALLNKMMQDPNKLVRIAALSAFASQLASGNDYTVQLLHNIQANPNADKEDVLQAADILLKMSAGVEVKNIPNPSVKENNVSNKKA